MIETYRISFGYWWFLEFSKIYKLSFAFLSTYFKMKDFLIDKFIDTFFVWEINKYIAHLFPILLYSKELRDRTLSM